MTPVLEEQHRIGRQRLLLTAVLVAFAVFWAYIFIFATPDPGDRLKDQTFPHAAEPICKATLNNLESDGLMGKRANSPLERANLTDQANVELRRMVGDLRAIAPTDGEAAAPVTQWLGDWDIWLNDRDDWSRKLRDTNKDQPFLETARTSGSSGTKGEPNSKELDRFASEVNDMPDCATPEDV